MWFESLDHMLFHCESVQLFWKDLQGRLQSNRTELSPLTQKTGKAGSSDRNLDLDFVFNILLLLSKFLIHKCRNFQTKPSLINMKNELKVQNKSVDYEDKEAVKVFLFIHSVQINVRRACFLYSLFYLFIMIIYFCLFVLFMSPFHFSLNELYFISYTLNLFSVSLSLKQKLSLWYDGWKSLFMSTFALLNKWI